MSVPRWVRRGAALIVFPVVAMISAAGAQDKPPAGPPTGGGGGIQPMCPSCIPDFDVDVTPDNQNFGNQVEGTSGHQAVFTVRNAGTHADAYTLSCSGANVTCGSVAPDFVSLGAYEVATVTVTFDIAGTSAIVTLSATGESYDEGSYTVPVIRAGGPIATNIFPLGNGTAVPNDSLFADVSHPTGVNLGTAQFYLNGTLQTGTVLVGSKLVKRNLSLAAGTYTWKSKACSTQGWCDSTTTSFTMTNAPTVFGLDDSLPPANAVGAVGLIGGLPLPPIGYRGCPQTNDSPEIRIGSPPSYIMQPGSTAKPHGLVFAAAVSNIPGYLSVNTLTIDHKPSQGITCANFAYLEYSDFDWAYFTGTSPNDTLWSGYPYSDGGQLATRWDKSDESAGTLALWDPGTQWGHERAKGGPNVLFERLSLGRRYAQRTSVSSPLPAHRFLLSGSRVRPAHGAGTIASRRLPDPGAIKPSTFQLSLNGVAMVTNGVAAYSGVVVTSLERYGANVLIPTTALYGFNPVNPTSNNGGWNELIATISDSTSNTTSVRSRFPHIGEGPVSGLQLATMRDFSHLEQGECAAFGLFQCGSVFATHTISGLVTRDRSRALHLVYRSSSQRGPTILPIQLFVDRSQRAPDSLHVRAMVSGVAAGPLLRYAGRSGAPSGVGTLPLQENAHETRVMGAELDAPASGDVHIRRVTVKVTSFYLGASPREDSVSQDVVQTFLTDTLATRFGQGWQLAEVHRLVFGQNYGGVPAAVWLRGDGSWAVYRYVGGVWQPPAGETTRLVDSTAMAGLAARWVLTPENGATIGFRSDGWQVHTGDLLDNKTMFEYGAGNRLTGIKDPNGRGYRLRYDGGSVAVSSIRVEEVCCASASNSAPIAEFLYSGARLTQLGTVRGPSTKDSTRLFYASWDATNAYLDSIVDPRSTGPKPVFAKILYDPATRLPEQLQRPLNAVSNYRDPWRRAVPRAAYGRDSSPLERLPFVNQVQGTWIEPGDRPMDVRVDAFGGPTFVREMATDPPPGGFILPTSLADNERFIERDAAGRVTKIADARMFPDMADSVMYQYDGLGRVTKIIRATLANPIPGGGATLDTTRFTYDVLELGFGRWCSRMLTTTDVLGAVTTVQPKTTGSAAQCLPERIIGPINDTTLFTYGALTTGDAAGARPTQTRDPSGLVQSASYDATSWNTSLVVRVADNATSRFYYDVYGRPDSIFDPANTPSRLTKDYTGRVLKAKTGTGLTAPLTSTTYDPGGLVTQVDVSASDDAVAWSTATGTVQSTKHFFNQLGQLDSTVHPGNRAATGANHKARKQSWVRSVDGRPRFDFAGNGSYIARIYDDAGRVKLLEQSRNDGTLSADGERYADDAAKTFYGQVQFSSGPHRSIGQYFKYLYDNKGREVESSGWDNHQKKEYVRRFRGYTRGGLLRGDTLDLDAKVRVIRIYEYNRRGQRILAVDSVKGLNGASISGEQNGRTEYAYDVTSGRLTSVDAKANGNLIGRVRFQYDKGGRETWRSLKVGGGWDSLITLRTYDPKSRLDTLTTYRTTDGIGAPHYKFVRQSSTITDDLSQALISGSLVTSYTQTYGYSTDGLRRLVSAARSAGPNTSHAWTYDAFGNQSAEYTYSGGTCQGWENSTMEADNRLSRRVSAVCPSTVKRFWTDQAGFRLGQADTIQAGPVYKIGMSYTVAGQLYHSVTPWMHDLGHHDVNWHWYGPDGYRVMTHVRAGEATPYGLSYDVGPRTYYFNDGADVTLTVRRESPTGTYKVFQRYLTGGVDQQLAARINGITTRSVALVADIQGSTIKLLKDDLVTVDCDPSLTVRGPFGAAVTAQPGCGESGETGFAGASTPNSNGGYTYLRNRWYDPQTSRFLTQDPIGLAGGVNLYAYAGGNPVAFSDPFGLDSVPGAGCKRGNCTQSQQGEQQALSQGQVSFSGLVFNVIIGGGYTLAFGGYQTEGQGRGWYLRAGEADGLDVSGGTEGGASESLKGSFAGKGGALCGGVSVVNGCFGKSPGGNTISGGGAIGPSEVVVSGHTETTTTFVTRPKYLRPRPRTNYMDCSQPQPQASVCNR